jgi:hypothetical protein
MEEHEQCIVCLSDLKTIATDSTSTTDLPEAAVGARKHADAGDEGVQQHRHAKSLLRETTLRYHSSHRESIEYAHNATLVARCRVYHILEASDATNFHPWTA